MSETSLGRQDKDEKMCGSLTPAVVQEPNRAAVPQDCLEWVLEPCHSSTEMFWFLNISCSVHTTVVRTNPFARKKQACGPISASGAQSVNSAAIISVCKILSFHIEDTNQNGRIEMENAHSKCDQLGQIAALKRYSSARVFRELVGCMLQIFVDFIQKGGTLSFVRVPCNGVAETNECHNAKKIQTLVQTLVQENAQFRAAWLDRISGVLSTQRQSGNEITASLVLDFGLIVSCWSSFKVKKEKRCVNQQWR